MVESYSGIPLSRSNRPITGESVSVYAGGQDFACRLRDNKANLYCNDLCPELLRARKREACLGREALLVILKNLRNCVWNVARTDPQSDGTYH